MINLQPQWSQVQEHCCAIDRITGRLFDNVIIRRNWGMTRRSGVTVLPVSCVSRPPAALPLPPPPHPLAAPSMRDNGTTCLICDQEFRTLQDCKRLCGLSAQIIRAVFFCNRYYIISFSYFRSIQPTNQPNHSTVDFKMISLKSPSNLLFIILSRCNYSKCVGYLN